MYMTYPTLGRSGRLGNQLWQIGSTVGLARLQYHEESPMHYDVIFPRWKYFPYFSFSQNLFTDDSSLIADAKHSRNFCHWLQPRQRGYMHDWKCLNLAKNDMSDWVRPSNLMKSLMKPYANKIQGATAVHVRRGDYQKVWGGINLLSKEYYLDAWPKKGRVVIFSDDPKWCKDNLPRVNSEVIHESEFLDFHLMASCENHVISNSTFSWWAAFNSSNVTYPLPWIKGANLDIFKNSWTPVQWQ